MYKSLYYKAKRELNYSKIEISNAINQLYLKKYIVVGSRLTRNQVLQNATRKKVYDYLRLHIGAHIREIREKLSITPHVLNWHLNMLENFEYIYRIKFLKYVNFFPTNFNKNDVFSFLVLKNKNSLQIFKIILKNPFIRFESLKNNLNLQKSIISYHLDNLIKYELVFTQQTNNTVFYGINHDKIVSIKSFYNFSDEEIQKSIKKQTIMSEKISFGGK